MSSFNPFGSSKKAATPVEDDERTSEPQEKASSSWSFGGLMKPKTPSTAAQDPFGRGENRVDKLQAGACKRAADGLEVIQDVDKFIAVQKFNEKMVAQELIEQGCSEHLVEKFLQEHIDGDTLRYFQVEDIMRIMDLELFKARGLYTKIWRILGITMKGETIRIEAIDAQPTGASLVKILHKRLYGDEGKPSDEGKPADRPADKPQTSTDDREYKTQGDDKENQSPGSKVEIPVETTT